MVMQRRPIQRRKNLLIRQKMQGCMDISGGDCSEGAEVLQGTVFIRSLKGRGTDKSGKYCKFI